LRYIPALRANAGHQERHFPDDLANLRELARIRRADDEQAVAARVPLLRGKLCDDVIEAAVARDLQVLNIPRTRTRGAAENDDALVCVLQERLERISAEIRIHRDGIGLVALERFERISLGRIADIAALRIEDHRNVRIVLVDVVDRALEL